MASISRRGGSWWVRYRDPDGRQRSRTFTRKAEASRFASTVEADMARGQWLDPGLARVLFGEVAQDWRENLVGAPSSLERIDLDLKNHILPTFGTRPIGSIQRSHVQAWVKDRSEVLSPATLEVTYRHLGSIFRSAVLDGLIVKTPCVEIRLPAVVRPAVVPLLTPGHVGAMLEALPARYRGLVIVGAGAGLRPSELTGLTVPWVGFLRRETRVVQQLRTPGSGTLHMIPPKRGSVRTVSVGSAGTTALARYFEEFPPSTSITGLSGSEELLVFTTADGRPIDRKRLARIWNPAARAAVLPPGTTPHDYADLRVMPTSGRKSLLAEVMAA